MSVPPHAHDAADLRARADQLRRLARAIELAEVGAAARAAGPDTWSGRLPEEGAGALRSAARDLDEQCGLLRARAAGLDARAAAALTHPALACGLG